MTTIAPHNTDLGRVCCAIDLGDWRLNAVTDELDNVLAWRDHALRADNAWGAAIAHERARALIAEAGRVHRDQVLAIAAAYEMLRARNRARRRLPFGLRGVRSQSRSRTPRRCTAAPLRPGDCCGDGDGPSRQCARSDDRGRRCWPSTSSSSAWRAILAAPIAGNLGGERRAPRENR